MAKIFFRNEEAQMAFYFIDFLQLSTTSFAAQSFGSLFFFFSFFILREREFIDMSDYNLT